jgi:hypothetical protein
MRRLRVVVLVVLLVICAGSFWQAQRERGSKGARAPQAATPAVAAAPGPVDVAAGSVHLAVLNGTRQSGLARRLSRGLPAFGCVVVALGDAPHDTFTTTLLVNRRLDESTARRLAAALGGIPVVVEWDPRCDEDAVLVLGADAPRLFGAASEP